MWFRKGKVEKHLQGMLSFYTFRTKNIKDKMYEAIILFAAM
jgi:hypothetical protein